jgi:hypothetical protein
VAVFQQIDIEEHVVAGKGPQIRAFGVTQVRARIKFMMGETNGGDRLGTRYCCTSRVSCRTSGSLLPGTSPTQTAFLSSSISM